MGERPALRQGRQVHEPSVTDRHQAGDVPQQVLGKVPFMESDDPVGDQPVDEVGFREWTVGREDAAYRARELVVRIDGVRFAERLLPAVDLRHVPVVVVGGCIDHRAGLPQRIVTS